MPGIIDNEHGTITITENALSTIASKAAAENYGMVSMSAKSTSEELLGLFSFIIGDSKHRGVSVTALDETTFDIDLHVRLMYGLSMSAVAQNIISHVKYRIESLTGMTVHDVNIHVEDVWIADNEIE